MDETLKLMSVLTGDDSFEKMYNEKTFKKKGGNKMDDVLERYFNKGKTKQAEEASIALLKEGIDPETIAKCEHLPLEKVLELQKSIKVLA